MTAVPDATMPSERQDSAQKPRKSDACGAMLAPRQERFCGDRCRKGWWNAAHPMINRGPEGPREGTLKAAIVSFLRDNPGEWTKRQIADAIHAFEHSVGTRLSELRRANEPIEVRRGPGNVKLYCWVKA